MTGRVGTFCLVLHSHLPLLAHHGRWPVGEEWLYQSWAHSYLPLTAMLRRLASEGYRDLLTLGVTPVLAAQLDDPHCLRGVHDWLGGWTLRAHSAAARLPDLAAHEHRTAAAATAEFERHWRHGASPVLRALSDAGAVELLGGPAAHPFAPLLDARVRRFSLRAGLSDHAVRLGSAPSGIWAPECGYAPGMDTEYADAGVARFLVDGPALRGRTGLLRPVGDSDVLCAGRDLAVTYRVWSPRAGYPGSPEYRDFHTWDHASGLKPARVTGRRVPSERKRPYSPALAAEAVRRDARDFVDTVVARLQAVREELGRPGLTVAAFDTELFGHWWHEGPAWLEAVLRALPAAGVAVRTLRGAVDDGLVGDPVTLPECSWGSGKDWRVWAGPQVADLVAANAEVQRDLLAALDTVPVNGRGSGGVVHNGGAVAGAIGGGSGIGNGGISNGAGIGDGRTGGGVGIGDGGIGTSAIDEDRAGGSAVGGGPVGGPVSGDGIGGRADILRDPLRDLLADQALHALASDWAFMVTKDSAAEYARGRAALHAGRVHELAGLLRDGRDRAARRRIAHWADARQPLFGHLDARDLAPPAP